MKMYYSDLVQDPNTKMWVCPECCDDYDPWRLPARAAEDITLDHPRPDESLARTDSWLLTEDDYTLLTESGEHLRV
jgi:hypothetical protein